MFLQGSFALISPAALIQTLCQEQRTATIIANRNGCTARVWIVDGLLMGARYHEHHDEEALYRLAQWADGIFTVAVGADDSPGTMAAEAEAVLLEAARRRDEGDLRPTPLPPADLHLDLILAGCPALAGGTLVRSDGASITTGMPASAPLVATSLAAIGMALGNTSGIAAYIGPGQRLLFTRSAAGHILLTTVRPGESLGEAGAQIERVCGG
ncbi:MAG: DUF4388 domain-containing protein [Oscillochloris sp.]|nr:DUF4388 domain-containing protein [Oscillochloris sp.]